MRDVPQLWAAWRSGVYVGDTKTCTRVTVETSYRLRTTAPTVGNWNRGPARWYQRASTTEQIETEIPNVEQVSMNTSIDADAGTCDITITNIAPVQYGQLESPSGQFGQPGYFTWDRGQTLDTKVRWGHMPNVWANVLVPNALIRTYQGFGGNDKILADALADGNLVLTGVWLVDDVAIGTDGTVQLRCRDMAKLLIDQQIYPPLVPEELFPLRYERYSFKTFAIPPDPPAGSGSVCYMAAYGIGPGPHSSIDALYGTYNTGVTGHPPADAFDMSAEPPGAGPGHIAHQNTLWLSEPKASPNDSVWIEFSPQADGAVVGINEIYFHAWAGLYTVQVSIFENGGWVPPEAGGQGGFTAHGVPYVGTFSPVWEGGQPPGLHSNKYPLPRDYSATRVRLTVTGLRAAAEGGYRAGARKIMACFNWDQAAYPIPAFAAAGLPYNTDNVAGYWQARGDGRIYAFGDARLHDPNSPFTVHNGWIVAMAAHPSGNGYWTLDLTGRVVSYGAATHHGDLDGIRDDVVDLASSPTGDGYWLLCKNGTVYNFGDTTAYGPATVTGTMPSGAPVIARSIESHPSLSGYWVLSANGTVEAFGVTHHGNANRTDFTVAEYVASIRRTHTGNGYWITSGGGIVQKFGDADVGGHVARADDQNWATGLCWDLIPSSTDDKGVAVQRANGMLATLGDFASFGSIGSGSGQQRYDGNYRDYADIVRDLLLWSGFHLFRDPQPAAERPDVYGNIENTGIYSKDLVPLEWFNKRPPLEAIKQLKQIVGYLFYIDAEGAARFECVDSETDAFTRRGWVSEPELAVDDEVLSYNPETRQSEWVKVVDVSRYDVDDEELVSIEGRQHSSLTTKGHRWWVEAAHKARRGRWRESADLRYEDTFPISAPRGDAPTEAVLDDALVELVAWWYTEGTTRPGRTGVISQSLRANPELVDRIRTCFEKLGGPVGLLREGNAWCEYPSAKEMVCWRFNGTLFALLNDCAPDRVPTMEFLTNLTAPQAQMFVDVSVLADGHTSGGRYSEFFQKDQRRVAAFESACVLAGRAFRTRHYSARQDIYRVKVSRSTTVKPVGASKNVCGTTTVTNVPYTGRVWCPKLERNHIWLARRKGTVYFTGNSPNWWQMGNFLSDGTPFAYMPEIDETVNLLSHQITFSGQSARSRITIATSDPVSSVTGGEKPKVATITEIVPQSEADLKGMVVPATWFNGMFMEPAEQRIMADLIGMQIWFQRRTAQFSCVGNPLIGINDQVRVIERTTGEVYVHYITGIQSTFDAQSGDYTMNVTTHWMGGTPYGKTSLFMAGTSRPQGDGYWQVSVFGSVYAFGEAEAFDSNEADSHLDWVISLRSTPSGEGYWTLDLSGKVLSYGDAVNYGSLHSSTKDITDMAITPTGLGYWILAGDGTVHGFGDAVDHGSATVTGNMQTGSPKRALSIEAHPSTSGYWVLVSDGAVQAFNVVPHGNANRVGYDYAEYTSCLRCTESGDGYWIVSGGGIVQAFGDAPDRGDGVRYPDENWVAGLVWELLTGAGDGYAVMHADATLDVFAYEHHGASDLVAGDDIVKWPIVTQDHHNQMTDKTQAIPVSIDVMKFLEGTGSPAATNAVANNFGTPSEPTIKAVGP